MKTKIPKRTRRFYDTARFGQPQIRVYHRKARGRKTPRYLLKCGCCEEKLEIFYLPLLSIERKGKRLIDRKV